MAQSSRQNIEKSKIEDTQSAREGASCKQSEAMATHFFFTPDLTVSVSSPKAKFTAMRCKRKTTLYPDDYGPNSHHYRHHEAESTPSPPKRPTYQPCTSPGRTLMKVKPLSTSDKEAFAQRIHLAESEKLAQTTAQLPQAEEQRDFFDDGSYFAACGGYSSSALVRSGSNYRRPAVSED